MKQALRPEAFLVVAFNHLLYYVLMKTSGEFLIFLLLLITNGRVFFVEQRKDSIVLLSPVAFVLSIFQILSWGFDIFTGLGFLLALLVLLSNFHALYRYFERLYVDHYTVRMYIWAISTSLISALSLIFLIYFAPSTPLTNRHVNTSAPNIKISTERYTGDFRSGFNEATPLQKTNLALHTFIKEEKTPSAPGDYAVINSQNLLQTPVFVFFPDKRAETYHYIPYLLQLAELGYTVISSDINTKDSLWLHNFFDKKSFRRFGMIVASLHDKFYFDSQAEFYTYNYSLECEAVLKLVKEKFPAETKYILASDFMANTAIQDYQKTHPQEIAGLFYMNELDSSVYKTAGYGFVDYTDPLLAAVFEIDRDKSGENSKRAAILTKEKLDDLKSAE